MNLCIPDWLKYYSRNSDENLSPLIGVARVLSAYTGVNFKLIGKKFVNNKRRIQAGSPLIGHIHVPKTGGTYVNALQDQLPHVNFTHAVVRESSFSKSCPVGLFVIPSSSVKSFYLFSTVRNPLNFLVSYFHHVQGFDGYECNKQHYDYELSNRGFKEFVLEIIGRENGWPSKRFLFPQLFCEKGTVVVDWVNRNEVLNSDVSRLAQSFGISIVHKKKERASPKKAAAKSYFDEGLKRLVCETYYREMQIFGYKGEQLDIPIVSLENFKNSGLRYDYLTDRVYLNSRIL